MKRIILVLTVAAVVVTVAAVPATAQTSEGGNDGLIAQAEVNPNKAAKKEAKRAAKRAAKQAREAQDAAPTGIIVQDPAPADGGVQKKALPDSAGVPAGKAALLGAGALLVGGGILVHGVARRRHIRYMRARDW